MPSLHFYATADDLIEVLDFVFSNPGWRLVESASRHDQPLRWFESSSDVCAAFDVGDRTVSLRLYARSMRGVLFEEHVIFDPGAVPDARGRTDMEGWGFVDVLLGDFDRKRIRPSNANHNSMQRALRWSDMYPHLGPVDAWDWAEIERISRRLNHFIRRSAVGTEGSRPVLRGAAVAREKGAKLDMNW